MALKKTTTVKGFEANYWTLTLKRWTKESGHTNCCLSLYKDEATRKLGLDNILSSETKEFSYPGDLSTAQLYAKIVQSDMDNGVELNWFADAEAV